MKTQYKPGSAEHSIETAFAFIRLTMEDTSLLEEIPNGATVVPLPADDPEQIEISIRMGIRAARNGDNVYLMQIPSLTPASS